MYPNIQSLNTSIAVIRKLISLKFAALLLFVFAGQVTASTAIYCEMMESVTSQSDPHAGHDMSGHENLSTNQSDESCCDSLGSCSMSGCVPVAFITTSETGDIRLILTKLVSNNQYLPAQTINSLYRPPILS